ncbi:HBL092Cp [Eremothecium sinecaudum]|uniref:HBL092Cp n=1 Tax=Eremothecium sinecaudum TaxID=45286 RepID=A0A120K0Y4_9SACH|nr:HBL092Cp [Eremothecium sinecaudum]AMD18810.1 HBL092Cp [Eremothecium sinecaudum]
MFTSKIEHAQTKKLKRRFIPSRKLGRKSRDLLKYKPFKLNCSGKGQKLDELDVNELKNEQANMKLYDDVESDSEKELEITLNDFSFDDTSSRNPLPFPGSRQPHKRVSSGGNKLIAPAPTSKIKNHIVSRCWNKRKLTATWLTAMSRGKKDPTVLSPQLTSRSSSYNMTSESQIRILRVSDSDSQESPDRSPRNTTLIATDTDSVTNYTKISSLGCHGRNCSTDNSILSVECQSQEHLKGDTLIYADAITKLQQNAKKLRIGDLPYKSIVPSVDGSEVSQRTVSALSLLANKDSLSSEPYLNTGNSSKLKSKRSSSFANVISGFANMMYCSSSKCIKRVPTPVSLDLLGSPPSVSIGMSEREYLDKLHFYGKFIAVILCQDDSEFKQSCLELYIHSEFNFSNEPLDISLRKLLLILQIPKESQQVDRMITCFSKVYFSQNEKASLWESADNISRSVYYLLMLHTDYFNPHSKRKMKREEFLKIAQEDQQYLPKEIIQYFYDEITAREFPHFILPPFMTEEDGVENLNNGLELDSEKFSPLKIIESKYLTHRPELWPNRNRSSSINFLSNPVYVPWNTGIHIFNEEIDPYYYITNDDVASATLQVEMEKQGCIVPSIDKLDEPTAPLSQKSLSTIKDVKGGYLKLTQSIAKDVIDRPLDANSLSQSDPEDSSRYLKIIHVGKLCKLQVRKFSMANSSRSTWKTYQTILTTSFLLIIEGNCYIDPYVVKDPKTNSTNLIMEYPVASQVVSIIDCNGLLATPEPFLESTLLEDEDSEIFYLFSNESKHIFRCPSMHERNSWIEMINMVAATANCNLSIPAIANTIRHIGKWSTQEKSSKLEISLKEKKLKLDNFIKILQYCKILVPTSSKSKSRLLQFVKRCLTRVDWLIYEIRRNQIYIQVLKCIEQVEELSRVPEDRNSIDVSCLFLKC